MIRSGSSDAYAWAVQPNAYLPSRKGDSPTRTGTPPEVGSKPTNNTSNFSHVLRGHVNQRDPDLAGELVVWEYDQADTQPEVWVVRKSDDSLTHAWECESKANPERDSINPIVTSMQNGKSLIPSGGSSVQMILPSLDTMVDNVASLTVDVAAASIPAWATNTIFDGHTDTEVLLKALFRYECSKRNMKIYDTITAAVQADIGWRASNEYVVLWLRQASRIIYDHIGQTLIPLLKAQLTVDQYGYTTLA